MKTKIRYFIIPLLLSSFATNLFGEESIFDVQDHCLAYQAEKEMFFFSGVHVIGKSCNINANIKYSENEDRLLISVSTPIMSFDSDNGSRDEHVFEILGGKFHPNITFVSDWIETQEIKQSIVKGSMSLPGMLGIAGQDHPVVFQIQFKNVDNSMIVTGSLETSFSNLNIRVPKVGIGGIIADTADRVILLLHLRGEKISGEKALNLLN
ncbi:MAG: YceI family protein [Proteobacteria bacterium]|nr:YceI family protein [Pseudomonadota bacterium]